MMKTAESKQSTTQLLASATAPSPVRLTAEHQLELHTRTGKTLFNGSWHHGQMGLRQFATLMRTMWQAHQADDPYADWYLMQTYDELEEIKAKFKQYELKLTQQMENLRGFRVTLFYNTTPFTLPIFLISPLACIGVAVVEQVDYLARQLYTLSRIGLMPENQLTISALMGEVQTVFNFPRRWVQTGITRQDIKNNTQKADEVRKQLKDVPDDVIHENFKFAFLPKINHKEQKIETNRNDTQQKKQKTKNQKIKKTEKNSKLN